MTPTQARLITLKEVIDFLDEKMNSCEGEDNWVVIGNSRLIGEPTSHHYCPIGTKVEVVETSEQGNSFCTWNDSTGKRMQYINPCDLENRKHLDVDRYQAFKEVKDKCTELMNAIKKIKQT